MSRPDRVLTAALAVGSFAIYAVGACRTIYVGDSGELVTAVGLLGIPHPSGYPLYVLTGKIWTLIVPLGSVAFRMSLFSAAAAAASCSLLYWLGRRMGLDRVSSLLASSLLAFGPSFWSQANIQRVYALNALFVVSAMLVAQRWHRRRDDTSLVLAFFLCGLGASNHLFMGVFAAALFVFAVLVEPRSLLRPRAWLLSALVFLAGCTPYLYLPLRSRGDPQLDWGNPESLGELLRVVSRSTFWKRAWIEGPGDFAVVALDYLRGIGVELAWGGATLALIGVVAGWRARFVWLPLLLMAGNFVSMALHGSRSDLFLWHRYYIPSYLAAALLAGVGWNAVSSRLPRALVPTVLALPLVLLVSGWSASDRSRYRVAESFAAAVLESMPPGARLAAQGDNVLFPLMYLMFVEDERPDVQLIIQGVRGQTPAPLRFDPERDAVFFTHHPNWKQPALRVVPAGLVFRAIRPDQPAPEPVVPMEQLDGEADPRVPRDYLTRNLIGHFHYMLGVTFEDRDWVRARSEFRRAATAAPDNDVLFYNLGLIYGRNGLFDDAIGAFRRSERINPRELAGPRERRAADRLAEVEIERRRIREVESGLDADPSLSESEPGSAAHHRAVARLLLQHNETTAARGHLRQAVEIEGDEPGGRQDSAR